jgi:glutamate-1-semialdehyde 2,1-aminomutase
MTTEVASAIESKYRERTPRSAKAHLDAARVLPGGDTRAATFHTPYPLTFVRGQGARLWDIDGNEYLDLLGNYSSLVHGNAYPPIVRAVIDATVSGSAWAARNTHLVELAEALCDRLSVPRIRFTNSGSEAAMLAIQLAKLHTGRPKILMARYGYHGSHEDVQAGTLAGTQRDAVFGGVDGQGHDTLVAAFGDAADFETVLAERGNQIAAVLLEPIQGSGGLATASAQFLSRVAAATRRADAVFILDEVVTFRLAPGGQQSVLGIAPDLTLLGKLIGGGYPIGAVAGRAELLDLAQPPHGTARHNGTYNGNPVSAAAGTISVRDLTADRIDLMHELGAELQQRLLQAGESSGVPVWVRRAGSLLLVGAGDPPDGLRRVADPLTARLHLACTNQGLHFAPRGTICLSTALTAGLMAEAAHRFRAALDDLAGDLT